MGESERRCPVCGETENDWKHCAGCDADTCVDCVDWCHAEDDEPNGDYFCEACQNV